MARDRANIRIDIWADQEWRDLSASAQHLYLLLLSHPTLSYAGVADWKPGRLAAMTRGRTRRQILAARAELQEKFFIYVDEDSEEVLIRSFLKHDGLLKQPKLVVSMMNAYAAIASKTIREILAFEVQKLRKLEPTLKVWEVKQAQTLLKAKASDLRTFTPNADQDFTPAVTPNADHAQGLPTSTTTSTATKDKRIVQTSFERFWEIYPRRDGKKKALAAFEKALKTTSIEVILEGVTRYIAFLKTTTQQTAMPATWLNGERWNDEVLRAQFEGMRGQYAAMLSHAETTDLATGENYCQKCGSMWPCMTEQKKNGSQF